MRTAAWVALGVAAAVGAAAAVFFFIRDWRDYTREDRVRVTEG